jgi:hypothetical protein
METLTPQKIKEQYVKLPKTIQDIYFGNDDAKINTLEITDEIQKKLSLSDSTVSKIMTILSHVLLGLSDPVCLKQSLDKIEELKEEEKEELQKILDKEIFQPLKKELLELYPSNNSFSNPEITTRDDQTSSFKVREFKESKTTHLTYPKTEIGQNDPKNKTVELSVNYTPGRSLKETLLGEKVSATNNSPIQKEKSSFERRLAGFNDNEESAIPPKTSLTDPYREGV